MPNKARLQTYLIAGAAAAVLAVTAIVFLAFAGYLGLLYTMAPALAALSTGGALLVLAFLVVAVPRRRFARQDRRLRRQQAESELDVVEQTLRQHVDTLIAQGVRRYPSGTAIGTLVLGIAAGYASSVLNGRSAGVKRRRPPQ